MTSYYDFTPSTTALFQFQPTLDGKTYSIIIPWALFGRRYYVNCYALDGSLVFSVPLAGSPIGVALQSLTWWEGSDYGTTISPHGCAIGSTIKLTISGAVPDAYNGAVEALIIDASSFSYPLPGSLPPATSLGAVSFDLNLAGGYFNSTLVYRSANGQFEVSP